jgi:hypothetical protein
VRAPKGNLCLSAFSMHCDHDLTLAPLFMLVSVKAATVLSQPFLRYVRVGVTISVR